MDHDATKERLQAQLAQAHKRIANLQNLLTTSGLGQVADKAESNEKIVQALLNNSRQSIFLIDQSGTVLAVNDRFARQLGCEPSEMLGRCIYGFLPPDVAQRRRAYVEEAIRTGKPVRFEDQREGRWLDNSVYPILYEAAQTTRLLVYTDDITDRKQAEDALRESEQRFTAFMDNSPAIAWMKDEEGRYIYINKKYENTFTVRLVDWLGKTDYEVWPSETAERFRQTDRTVMKHGKPTQVIEEIVDPDGQQHYLLNTKFPLSYGARRYVAGIGVDITDRKQAEEKIHNLNQELAKRVRELKTMNEGLRTFSYSLSHDLRTPLVAIRGFSQRLLNKYAIHLDEKGQQYLKIVNENSIRMEALIADLLAFFRMGRKSVKASHINMADMVEEIFRQLRPAYPNRSIQLDVKTLPDMEGDEAMIRNVFTNLLDNAIKYSGQSDVSVVEVAGWVEKERTVYSVKDNGIGFPMEHVTKLFKAFERLHVTEEIAGAGLGLAIVKRIIRRHGGDVWAEAKVGEGATFYFSIPR